MSFVAEEFARGRPARPSQGVYMGVPPTGKAIVLTGTYIRRVADGRVAEEWDTTDIFGLAQQLGMIPG